MANASLSAAKSAKNDEFYTQLEDISREVGNYKEHFKGKTVLLNCDDPEWSNFWKYFHLCFSWLELKKLISTHFSSTEITYKLEYEGGNDNDVTVGVKTPLKANGDFRSAECVELLKEADIVCTNPPFSLFREFIALLMEHDKKFLVIGNKNAVTYKEFFPLLKDNRVWIGYNAVKEFLQPDGTIKKFGNIGWFTNLDIKKRHEEQFLYREYSPKYFPRYDNYDAINVDKVTAIPKDYTESIGILTSEINDTIRGSFETVRKETIEDVEYSFIRSLIPEFKKNSEESVDDYLKRISESLMIESKIFYCNGVMGVPITFLDNYSSDQFEIIGCHEPAISLKTLTKMPNFKEYKSRQVTINGVTCQKTYHRIFIRRKV